MKEDLVRKVSELHMVFNDLKEVWNQLDWSVVPSDISEQYPFHKDLGQMTEDINAWLELIKKS